MHSDFQTFRFIILISVFSALILSITATSLENKQDINIEVDRKKNVLKCAGVDVNKLESDKIINTYNDFIIEKVISESGQIVNLSQSDLKSKENKTSGQIYYFNKNKSYLPLFEYQIDGNIDSYIFPISGKGLWSTLYGYLALAKDLNTVKGITFYKHKETPGLGGEIEKEWFQNNFINKKIFDKNNDLVSITVAKGKASGKNLNHKVDGMSGATITGNGLTTFLRADLERYLLFINQQKGNIKPNEESGV